MFTGDTGCGTNTLNKHSGLLVKVLYRVSLLMRTEYQVNMTGVMSSVDIFHRKYVIAKNSWSSYLDVHTPSLTKATNLYHQHASRKEYVSIEGKHICQYNCGFDWLMVVIWVSTMITDLFTFTWRVGGGDFSVYYDNKNGHFVLIGWWLWCQCLRW